MDKAEIGKRLIAAYENGELQEPGQCAYVCTQSGKPCAVGYLLTEEQRQKVIAAGKNMEHGPGLLKDTIPDIEETTGLSIDELTDIQMGFDGVVNYGLEYFHRIVNRVCNVTTGAFDE